jgi:hypothetical protein
MVWDGAYDFAGAYTLIEADDFTAWSAVVRCPGGQRLLGRCGNSWSCNC